MKLYKCHKVVEAAKVLSWAPDKDVPSDVQLRLETGELAFLSRSKCGDLDADSGYFVQYEGGYISWSPSKAFEAGYTLIEDETQ